MKKSKMLIMTSLLVILTVTVAMLSGCIGKANDAEASLDFDGLASAPTQAAIDKATHVDKTALTFSETMTEDEAVLDSIEYLLRLSNSNLIDCDFFAAAAYGSGTASITASGIKDPIAGAMETREARVFDNGDYYFDTYGLVVDGYTIKSDGSHGSVPDSILSVLASALNFTKRTYSPNSQDFYFSNNGNTDKDTITKFPDQNAVNYKKPKSKKMTVAEYMEMNNSRGSFKSYTTDNYDNDKPITSGLLTYNEETGIYYLECEINCENDTLELSVADMLDISAIKTFSYAQKHLKIEIWECGLIRTYMNTNVWNATMILGIQGTSENAYEQWFTYDKSKLDKMNINQELKDALMK